VNTRTIIVVAAIGSATTIGSVLGIACSRGTSGSGGDLTQLEQDTGVRWIAVSNNTFGTTSYLYPTSTPPVALTSGMQPEAAAMAFLVQYGAVFQMVDPAHELAPEASGASSGLQFASFTQTEGTASVYGTRLTVVFDAGGPHRLRIRPLRAGAAWPLYQPSACTIGGRSQGAIGYGEAVPGKRARQSRGDDDAGAHLLCSRSLAGDTAEHRRPTVTPTSGARTPCTLDEVKHVGPVALHIARERVAEECAHARRVGALRVDEDHPTSVGPA